MQRERKKNKNRQCVWLTVLYWPTVLCVLGHISKVYIAKLCPLTFALDQNRESLHRPRQANLVLIAYASSESSGEPAHPRSLARTFAARSYKQ